MYYTMHNRIKSWDRRSKDCQ